MTGSSQAYEPHPYIGGRNIALRALAAWRMEWPGAPRVVLVTGSLGSGRSRLVDGFRMLCQAEHRAQLPLNSLDPAAVPPELPDPAVVDATGLTVRQVLWGIAEASGMRGATDTEHIGPLLDQLLDQLQSRGEPLTLFVPEVDRAGPVRHTDETARLVREVLIPLSERPALRLVADLPRDLAGELAVSLPPGSVQLIDLDEPQWADAEGLVLQAAVLMDPEFGAPDLPFTVDRAKRRAVADALVSRTGARGSSRLTVQLAVGSMLAAPEGYDPTQPDQLPATLGQVLDLHASRVGVDRDTLRQVLAPLALAEGEGLPAELLPTLVNAVAERDMRESVAHVLPLASPFVERLARVLADDSTAGDEEAGGGGTRELLRLVHPGLAEVVRAGFDDLPAVQSRIAMALLEAVPEQDWSKADPYVRDHIAAHTLEAGLLPQLLTDPGLFTFADPVQLRACVEAVPVESLQAPARTYRRTAPLLTRSGASERMCAALLETAFVEDGLVEHAAALHELVPDLPWRTLWSVPVAGVSDLSVCRIRVPEGSVDPRTGDRTEAEEVLPVAALGVPAGTPGAQAAPDGRAVLLRGLSQQTAQPERIRTDPGQVAWPTEDEQDANRFSLDHEADHVRVRHREDERVVASLPAGAELFTGAHLSPEGVLLVSTQGQAKALRIAPRV